MKRLFFTAAAAALLCSCGKDSFQSPDPEYPASDHTSAVVLSFGEAKTQDATKTFFDPTATAEAWEKSLTSVSALVFSTDGKLLVQRDFTASEVTAQKASFAIPNSLAGNTCEFYVVANRPVTDIDTKAQLMNLLENSPADYNGTFAQVSASARRSGGFVMTGSVTKAIAAQGQRTDVSVTLKRTVAKIAVQTSATAEFSQRYQGRIRINTAVLSKTASRSNLIAQQAPNTGPMTFTHMQAASEMSGKFNNLFYGFENGNLAAGNRVMLTLKGTYDRDGNFATESDQAEVTYEIELSGGGSGQIVRNGYYRIQVGLDGLTGSDASVSVSVADWETPVTQSVNLGA